MCVLGVGDSEFRSHVLLHDRILGDRGNQSRVDLGLVSLLRGAALRSLLLLEESLSTFASLSDRLLEVGIVELFQVHLWQSNLSGGGDHVSLVHTAKRDTVDLVRSSDKE